MSTESYHRWQCVYVCLSVCECVCVCVCACVCVCLCIRSTHTHNTHMCACTHAQRHNCTVPFDVLNLGESGNVFRHPLISLCCHTIAVWPLQEKSLRFEKSSSEKRQSVLKGPSQNPSRAPSQLCA